MGCFVYVVFGGTRAVTIGPTALLGMLTHNSVVMMGPDAAVFLAFLSGLVELLMGLLNFGFLIEYLGAPVIAGFSAAAAFAIATTQIKSLLGLKFTADGFLPTWNAISVNIGNTRLGDAVMGFTSIVLLLALRVFIENFNDKSKAHRTTLYHR